MDDGKFYIDTKNSSDGRIALNANKADKDKLGNTINETYITTEEEVENTGPIPKVDAEFLGGIEASEYITNTEAIAQYVQTKPNDILSVNNQNVYPVTYYNQIIMPDGSKWNGTVGSGTGNVKTVNSKSPDNTGNIQLNANDVGARSNTWMPNANDVGARPNNWLPTPQEIQALPVNGTAANSNLLAGLPPTFYMPCHNFLDNSFFYYLYMINQRNYGGNTVQNYEPLIDRWRAYEYNNRTKLELDTNTGYCKLTGEMYQGLCLYELPTINVPYTIAVYFYDGSVLCASGNIPFSTSTPISFTQNSFTISGNVYVPTTEEANNGAIPMLYVSLKDTSNTYNKKILVAVALYLGEFTSETVPPYVVKEPGAEFAKCLRYLQMPSMSMWNYEQWKYVPMLPMVTTPSVTLHADDEYTTTYPNIYASGNDTVWLERNYSDGSGDTAIFDGYVELSCEP